MRDWEIAKSVSLNCKLLILDEPTSSLTEKETARLFDLVKELSGSYDGGRWGFDRMPLEAGVRYLKYLTAHNSFFWR